MSGRFGLFHPFWWRVGDFEEGLEISRNWVTAHSLVFWQCLGTIMAPQCVSFSLLIEDQGLVGLSAILDPFDSNWFMLCPWAMSFFQKLCPASFPPIPQVSMSSLCLSRMKPPKYLSTESQIFLSENWACPHQCLSSGRYFLCFNWGLGVLNWLPAPPSIFQQSPTHNQDPGGIFISQCLPSRPLSPVSYWEGAGTCYTPPNKNSGSQLVWEIWGPGETYPKPPNAQGSRWAQGASAGTTVPVSPRVQVGERNCSIRVISFSMFLIFSDFFTFL